MIRPVAAALVLLLGCQKDSERPPPSALEIAEVAAIKTGAVGYGAARAPATYALVDVTNRSSRDLIAEVGGELFDLADNSLGETRPETLRIDAGQTRMFALVDAERRVLDNAVRVTPSIEGLSYAHDESPVRITELTQHRDHGRAVVAGYLENLGGGDVTAMVIAGFYDEAGAPLERVAAPYALDGRGRRGIQEVGPAGSARGSLFVGDFN